MQVIGAGARPSTPAEPARYSGEVWTDALIEGGPPGSGSVARGMMVATRPIRWTSWD